MFVEAVDVMGNNATDSLVVGVDSTPPRFVKHNFEKNVDSGNPQLPYSSRFVIFMWFGLSHLRQWYSYYNVSLKLIGV